MNSLWRISAHLDLEGHGGRFISSRWSSAGHRIVYLAESPAGAMLEILVHLQFRGNRLPKTYSLLRVEFPETLAVEPLNPPAVADWKERIEPTQRIGDAWLASLTAPLARVPSAVVPRTWNCILNPEHRDATQAKIAEVVQERFDNRLFRFGRR
jgi:RES domain-containing protein